MADNLTRPLSEAGVGSPRKQWRKLIHSGSLRRLERSSAKDRSSETQSQLRTGTITWSCPFLRARRQTPEHKNILHLHQAWTWKFRSTWGGGLSFHRRWQWPNSDQTRFFWLGNSQDPKTTKSRALINEAHVKGWHTILGWLPWQQLCAVSCRESCWAEP